MNVQQLGEQIKILAALPETEAPVVSCYIDLTDRDPQARRHLHYRATQLAGEVSEHNRQRQIGEAVGQIWRYLDEEVKSTSRGLAIFARSGKTPFMLPLQLPVSVPNWISIDTVPNIYHLVELKDTYHRYVVLLADRASARVFEVNLGSVTTNLWLQQPELRARVGREWTRLHYQNHRRDRGRRFIKEKIGVLERLMSQGGHTHLILAGDPRRLAEIRQHLPKRLENRLTDTVTLSRGAKEDEVVAATLESFIKNAQHEADALIERLLNAFYKGDLVAVGPAETMQALLRSQTDAVLLTDSCQPGPVRWCQVCGWAAVGHPLPDTCAECGSIELRDRSDAREEIVRLAQAEHCRLDIVKSTKQLRTLGDCGALLRYNAAYSGAPATETLVND
ncbi:hypothetical protein GF420_08055 [candidate division GN15 bacterium]|nr:hypothetical protein [candidate division GN15 bacterium]